MVRWKQFGVAIAVIAVAGCGALFNSGPQMVNFTSEPVGAAVWVDGTPRGQTPIALGLAKNQTHVVLFKLDGYNEFGATLNKKVSGGYIVLDVLGGLVPVVIDAATGSWYKLDANTLHGPLTKKVAELGEPAGTLTKAQVKELLRGVKFDDLLRE